MRLTMKGFVTTPSETVDAMIELLFRRQLPRESDRVLDPGCGTGEFIDGIIRWCQRRQLALPQITGIESDPRHLPALRAKYEQLRAIHIEHDDFLSERRSTYEFIVGNPPYVPITGLSEAEKGRYRARYSSARGRFDLYLLFFEEGLRRLAPSGRLVFITPEKYLYVETAGPLRELLARSHVEQIHLVREDTFGELVTYPTITVVNQAQPGKTEVVQRSGATFTVKLPFNRASWLPLFEGSFSESTTVTLGDLSLRLSCGVATGADAVFVHRVDHLDPALRPFAHPTISGRELSPSTTDLATRFVMLIPYGADSRLLPLEQLGELRHYLLRHDVRRRLLARTCVIRKPWYAFHETPMLRDILRPKILCKDIGEAPHFWVDRSGEIVPRHSVYYLVPREPAAIDVIVDYLRSPSALAWFARNCQRAAKGFLRLQSHVLQRLPVPEDVVRAAAGGMPGVPVGIRPLQAELSFR
jgi:adenine-specific DNA-methyltransferase